MSLISNLSLLTCTFFTFYRLSRYILSCKIFTLLFFSLENDDIELSKRCVKLISLIFIIRCLTKCNLIQIMFADKYPSIFWRKMEAIVYTFQF